MTSPSFIGFDEIPSTNTYALENIANLSDKTVISAAAQTQGHGRFNRNWHSDNRENLYLSIVLKPTESLTSNLPISNLTQYLSVVLSQVLDSYGVSSQIKWPNDVLVNGSKIAGILAQSSIKEGKLQGIVLGLGVNLNSTFDELSQIDQKATSLNLELGRDIDKETFLREIIDRFFDNYEEFLSKGFEMIKNDYTQKSFFLGSQITIKEPNNTYNAIANTINNDGTLNVKTVDGLKNINTGDVLLTTTK
jgi:BirA family biotin operon repressor/biotin-[acetyl-CoA-carboxylase] ligase